MSEPATCRSSSGPSLPFKPRLRLFASSFSTSKCRIRKSWLSSLIEESFVAIKFAADAKLVLQRSTASCAISSKIDGCKEFSDDGCVPIKEKYSLVRSREAALRQIMWTSTLDTTYPASYKRITGRMSSLLHNPVQSSSVRLQKSSVNTH